MLAKNLTIHCPFWLSHPSFTLLVPLHIVWGLGGMTQSFCGTPGQEQVTLSCYFFSHTTRRCFLAHSVGGPLNAPHSLDFSVDSPPVFPPKTKSPAFLLHLLPYVIGNSFTLPFFICLSSRMGEPGGAAVPLKQI